MSEVVDRLTGVITPLMAQENVELVDLTYQKGPNGWTVALFIDKPGGVSLDDCTLWSGRVGQILEETDMIPHAYSLEVSSPGLDRPLKKLADYQRFLGERVSVKLYSALNGQKNFHGILKQATEGSIVVMTDEEKEVELPIQQVAKSKLDPKIEF